MWPAQRQLSRPGGWFNRDFHDEVPAERGLLERGATAALTATFAFIVFLLAMQHENAGCGDACYDGGLRTREPGHAWTAYSGSWQWQAQWGLGLCALLLGIGALTASTRWGWRRWAFALNAAAALCAVAWLAWRVLEPAIPT
jgi:hypothetical protein